jgi:delta1-piperideine-2-carboxylate reductase
MSDPVRLSLAEVHALAMQVLRAHGLSDAHARAIADTITDAAGQPTTDPAAALAGAQLPFGGYKGAAIALMIELLAGALIGEVLSFEASMRDNHDGGPPGGGEFMIAIDPVCCVGHGIRQQQLAHAEQLFAHILAQEGTRLPSDRRYAARQRTPREGITIPRALYDELQHTGERRDSHGSNG